jgi:hypothetical protein
MRFYLIALVPALLLLVFALVGASRRTRAWVLALACLATVGPAVPLVTRGGHAIISDTAYGDLLALRGLVPPSEKALVVAAHGAEWWVAWVLRTHIAQAPAVREDDWARFDAVYFLDVKQGLVMPGPGPRRGPGRDGGPPRGFAPPPPPPMMAGAAIPSTADIVYDGPALRLARVLTPPEFVARQGAR